MGNLYTRIIRQKDSRLSVLQRLRFAWHTFPRNYKLIYALQQELNNIIAYRKKKFRRKGKPLKSTFNGYYYK